ncbi:ABC transporter ATP-binding protein [Ilumatobacter sp.]|uniref:ABC transporter ATP-binding protein n=1 Tax=Ilumatobacter sp. TaxID=1967498 RepID=UPI003B5182C3
MSGSDDEVVLRGVGLAKHFTVRRKGFGRADTLVAVADTDIELRRGETLGIVGESGCGKSTLSRMLIGDAEPTEGHIELLGERFDEMGRGRLKEVRREIQMVHQDPYKSLDPRMTIEQIVREPLDIHAQQHPRAGRASRVAELLELVGLNPDQAQRRPGQLSGGQRQRVDIARALALDPGILVCDEAVSALDVSVQAQIINLLADLKAELGLAMIFVSHDLSVVQHVADRVAVMYLGRIVEQGPWDEVYDRTLHPYTTALLAAAPSPDRSRRNQERVAIVGEPPSPLDPPPGCAFNTRCDCADDRCIAERPSLGAGSTSAHLAACHHPLHAAASPA